MNQQTRRIIFFDGVCGLCNFFVDFLIKTDKKQKFLFCSLQSEKAHELLVGFSHTISDLNLTVSSNQFQILPTEIQSQKNVETSRVESDSQKYIQTSEDSFATVIFLKENSIYKKAKAIQEIFFDLGGVYLFFAVIIKITPLFISDRIYDFIAHNRYQWFGKKSVCRIPTENEKSRFV